MNTDDVDFPLQAPLLDCKLPRTANTPSPFSLFVNVALDDGRQATILLENPRGVKIIEENDAKNIAEKF